jgi:hypothetical protein
MAASFVRTTLQADKNKIQERWVSGQVRTRGICFLWFL